jgi:hypothetical protein
MQTSTLLIYGATGVGKTLDVHHAFAAFKPLTIVTERGALDSVVANLGVKQPAMIELNDTADPYSSSRRCIDMANKAIAQNGHQAVIMDTGSALAERLFVKVARDVSYDGRRLYPRVEAEFVDITLRLLDLPAWVVMICHESPFKTTERGAVRGGPKLPSGGMIEQVCGMFSIVLRAVKGLRPGSTQVERLYLCDQMNQQFIMKDRFGAAQKSQPLDLRPILWRIIAGDQALPPFPAKPIRVQDEQAAAGNGSGNLTLL